MQLTPVPCATPQRSSLREQCRDDMLDQVRASMINEARRGYAAAAAEDLPQITGRYDHRLAVCGHGAGDAGGLNFFRSIVTFSRGRRPEFA
jgi:hypothetical protein